MGFWTTMVSNSNQMGADGVIDINASTTINIAAPTIAVKASTLNITGGSGDCKIKNVSLLNHVHQET